MADQENISQENLEAWNSCGAGTLGSFASRERGRRLRRNVLSIAACSVLIVAACYAPSVGSKLWKSPNSGQTEFRAVSAFPPYGGLACKEVVDELEPFFAGSVSEEQRGRIRQHLDDCPACHGIYLQEAESRGVTLAQSRQAENWAPVEPRDPVSNLVLAAR